VDFAGTVESSTSPEWKSGDKVVLTGWRVGEMQWGGYAQKARVKASQLVKLPAKLSTKQAMAIGTAGFTAMMSVMLLEDHGLTPDQGEVLITGAAGGVGSTTLASVLAQIKYRGSVAACGLAGGNDLPTTVLPFLLRGVKLLGIDSVMCPVAERRRIWDRLARDLPLDKLDAMTAVAGLADLPGLSDKILKGGIRGRLVVDLDC
ncbi:MAG TPA: oxidoreductase, partial [Stellaceae bacterium]|nr:oxidoreductase [Stellaceae bacterium]